MKPLLFLAILFLFVAASVSYEVKPTTGEVIQIEGMYIFTDCKPVKEYVYLGTVKNSGGINNPQYSNVRDYLIKRAKKEYDDADGLILTLNAGGADVCDVIKFK